MAMDSWDIAILVGGSFLSVMALVRLMVLKRDRLLAELGGQLETARKKRGKPAARPSH